MLTFIELRNDSYLINWLILNHLTCYTGNENDLVKDIKRVEGNKMYQLTLVQVVNLRVIKWDMPSSNGYFAVKTDFISQ